MIKLRTLRWEECPGLPVCVMNSTTNVYVSQEQREVFHHLEDKVM
jgi:hypothetical protein